MAEAAKKVEDGIDKKRRLTHTGDLTGIETVGGGSEGSEFRMGLSKVAAFLTNW